MIKYNCHYSVDGWEKEATWSHIVKLYEFEVIDANTRMLNKVTDQHIYENKIQKMKVKNAAQIFSCRVATAIN